MKDFTLNEAAEEAASNFPGVPRDIVKQICRSMMESVIDIVENKKGRIRIQNGCIHTIYFDVVPDQQRAKFADLDESRELTLEEEQQSILQRLATKQNLPRTIKRLNSRYKRVHYERVSPDAIYPK